MAPWPELLKKQLDDYGALDEDWRAFAADHAFPYLDQRLPDMEIIHSRLPSIIKALNIRAQELLALDCDLVALLYVGIGCGAGWVTKYAGQREQAQLTRGSGLWWQLYTEGFAQWSEHLMLGRPTWHMQDEKEEDWLDWCRENRGWLAAEFLCRVNEGEEVRPFFGSWYNIQGYKQTGYFLGCEVIQTLAADWSMREIALIEDMAVVSRALETLRR